MTDVDAILAKIEKLPPMPQAVQRVAALLQDPDVSASRLIEAVHLDPALTANVLRMCNSAYYGTLRRVTSLGQALTLIGNHGLMDMIIAQGSSVYFRRDNLGYDLARGQLWRHSVAVALASQILSRRLTGRGDAALYTAALLHDIGKVVLSEFVAEGFQEIEDLVRDKGYSFEEAEKAVVGIDHAELGGRICELWNFPAQLVSAIRNHHHPVGSGADTTGDLVCLSDLMCLMLGIGVGADGLAYHGGDQALDRLGLKGEDMYLAMAGLAEEMQRAEELLNM
jgi:putative nucleotidyltransferase with HDIG domain